MQVSVHGSPAAWWQHAGHAALQECHLISRRQAPISGIAQRRANRQLYQVIAGFLTRITIAVARGCVAFASCDTVVSHGCFTSSSVSDISACWSLLSCLRMPCAGAVCTEGGQVPQLP